MILLLGSIGWGLFAAGAVTHLVHFSRLRELLALHFPAAEKLAPVLVAVEFAIAVALPLAFSLGWQTILVVFAIIAGVFALGFTVWVGQLLLQDSELPCACSFSSAPTSNWSLLRSAGCLLAVVLPIASWSGAAEVTATLMTGAALALALFVLPDALAWPDHARYFASNASNEQTTGHTALVTITPNVINRDRLSDEG